MKLSGLTITSLTELLILLAISGAEKKPRAVGEKGVNGLLGGGKIMSSHIAGFLNGV